MRDFLNDIPLLVEVARHKSFTKAADTLEMGASTLSRRIKELEQRMGVLLFYRDTRNVALTDTGAFLLDRCAYVLDEAQKAYEAVVRNMQKPAGLVRISTFQDLHSVPFKQALMAFAAAWPEIQLDVSIVEHPVDMRTDPYDVAFLIGSSVAPHLVARKLLTVEPYLYASPRLLERYAVPEKPEDLYQMPCIVLERFGRRWPMHNGDRHVTLEMRPRYTFSSAEMCREFALAGHGVALIRDVQVREDEAAGRLVRLLPAWAGGFAHTVSLVTGSGQLPKRVRLFVDHMLSVRATL